MENNSRFAAERMRDAKKKKQNKKIIRNSFNFEKKEEKKRKKLTNREMTAGMARDDFQAGTLDREARDICWR
jgi:hypothetical protein